MILKEMAPDNIDPNIWAWLKQKGFIKQSDILRLEAEADSLTHALLVLSHAVPKSERKGSAPQRMIPASRKPKKGYSG
jgi:hypothetical protein